MSPSTPRPKRIAVRMFQVGFGDCFLLSFDYERKIDGRSERHVLIDFGSTNWPKGYKRRFPDIAASIADRTGGKLDGLVLTHRHKDHLSGYADTKAAAAIAALEPSVVLRPWTENPKAAEDARRPALLSNDSRRFAAGLRVGQGFAEQVWNGLYSARSAADRPLSGTRGALEAMAFAQLSNRKAIHALDRMAATAEAGGEYLFADRPTKLQQMLPGVAVSVLGPPTVDQWPAVVTQRDDDPTEFWFRRRAFLANMLDEAAERFTSELSTSRAEIEPGPARWLVERMHDQQAHSLLRIVRTLDEAMNNTSLLLLFEAGDRKLLFPGDAQIENWGWSLDSHRRAVRRKLADVDFYKVGHHGSRNATPKKSLVTELWGKRSDPLTSLMSTMPHVHGEEDADTEVPREALVTALEKLGPLHRTDTLGTDELFIDVVGNAGGHKPFERVT